MTQEEREAPGGPKGPETAEGERGALSEPGNGTLEGTLAESGSRARARGKADGHPNWPDVLADLERAVPLEVACRCAGLSPDAVRASMGRHPSVLEAVEKARAAGERALLTGSGAAVTLDPKHAQWRLERLYPDRYHLANRIALGQDPNAAPVQSDVRVTLELAQAGARDDYDGPMPALPASTRKR